MSRRSTPQAQIDERAFPVRILIRVSGNGFGKLMEPMNKWLNRWAGRQNYAFHGAGRFLLGGDAVALYLRTPEIGAGLLAAFPMLELADGTSSVAYSSPNLPFGRPEEEDEAVCNLYNQTRAQDAMRQLFKGFEIADRAGNLEPGRVYPDQLAPIVRHREGGGLEIVKARWGMPSPPSVLKTARDPGVTNVRNTASRHWRRWLGPANRCLVPLTAFAEPKGKGQGNAWIVAADGEPMFFAGVETRGWQSVRKIKDGETVDDLYAFLTCPPNAEVGAVHPKAMPVILTRPDEWEAWLSWPFERALALQRPLPDGALKILEDEPA